MELESMSNSELVELFKDLSVQESEAVATLQGKRLNRLIRQRWAVKKVLRHRTGDARRELFVLYDHDNPQVQLNVAESTYALNPSRARSVMEQIASSRFLPWSAHAGISLMMLDDGTSALPNDPDL